MTREERQRHALECFRQAYEHQVQGCLDEAIAGYQRSLDLHPTAEAYTFLGWAYSYQGRYGEAIQECLRAIDVDPDFGNPYNDIGAYLIELGQLDQAVPWLRKAAAAKRYDSRCFPHFNMGRVFEQTGQWMQAVDSYRSALRANPTYALAARALSRVSGMLN